MKVMVTGANGFVGQSVVATLADQGHEVLAVRGPSSVSLSAPSIPAKWLTLDLTTEPPLGSLLKGVDAIIHLAGKAHSRDRGDGRDLEIYRKLNVAAVKQLAYAAAREKVRRFVLVSTIHVNGHETCGQPFTENDTPSPASNYARSKLEGEQVLAEISAQSGLAHTIVRPPLVVGRNGKANLSALLKLIDFGLPLPFGAINNRRSFIALDNLAHFLAVCAQHPRAANQSFVIADDPVLSTPELIASLAERLDRPSRLIKVPHVVITKAASLMGLNRRFGALWQSLEVDAGKAKALLGWTPPSSLSSALTELARSYRRS